MSEISYIINPKLHLVCIYNPKPIYFKSFADNDCVFQENVLSLHKQIYSKQTIIRNYEKTFSFAICLLRRPETSATVNQSALLHRTQRIRCSFYSSKDQAKSRGEFLRRWASIQPDILLTGLLFVSLQKQNLFI